MSAHIAILASAFAALAELAAPSTPSAVAQDFRAHQLRVASSQVITLYDRVTDSTRVMVSLPVNARPFGLGSRVWLDAHFSYPGRSLPPTPELAAVTLLRPRYCV